jgi:TPR repeat protein
MGSFVRQTLIQSASSSSVDADIAAVFQADNPFDAYTSFNPEQLVRKVAYELANLGRSMKLWEGQTITITFDDVKVDVWPAFRLWDEQVFQFPGKGNQWFTSNPSVFDERFVALNRRTNGRLGTLARCLKAWNVRNGSLLPSFHLEHLLMSQEISPDESLQSAISRIFAAAKAGGNSFLSVRSADGVHPDLALNLSYEERTKMSAAFSKASNITNAAATYETKRQYAAANLCWRRVFGGLFPEPELGDAELSTDLELAWLIGLLKAEEGDIAGGATLLRRAASAGHAEAAGSLGQIFLSLNDAAQAMPWLIAAADGGVAGAAFRLGELHGRDEDTQLTWYEQAATLGHAEAMIILGMRASLTGNLAEAETRYRAAVATGSVRAMVNLGTVLMRQPDRTPEGIDWWRKAAKTGDMQARYLLAEHLASNSLNSEEAMQLWESAASDGDEKSMINLARACERDGRAAEAAHWYRKAADKGNAGAAERLSELGLDGSYLKWRAQGRWFSVDPLVWVGDRLREHFVGDPDRFAVFAKPRRFAVIKLYSSGQADRPHSDDQPQRPALTQVSEDGTLFLASLVGDDVTIRSDKAGSEPSARSHLHGADQPQDLAARYNLAHQAGLAGDALRARDLLAELLPDQERVLGPDDPSTFKTRHELAHWTGVAGNPDQARDLLAELLPDRERVLGREDPSTLATRQELAAWTGVAGNPDQARDLLAELLPVYANICGQEHPDTLTIRHNLATLTGTAGDAARARDLLAELLPDRERICGREARDTLDTRLVLAHWTSKAGDSARSRDMLTELLPMYEKVLGRGHPNTLTTRGHLAFSVGEAGDPAKARDLLAELLRDKERLLGREHLSTIQTRSDLAIWTDRATHGER